MYRIIVMLMEPYTFLVMSLVFLTGLAWWRQKPRTWLLRIATMVLGLLYLCSMSVNGYLLMRTLEASYPPKDDAPAQDDIVVVLSSGVINERDDGSRWHLDATGTARCLYALKLYHKAGHCRLLLSGGKVDDSDPAPLLADAMRDFLVDLGVKSEDVLLENNSKSTFENAAFTVKLLNKSSASKIWLVTAASHMDRSVRCFEKQGVSVIASPCDHETLVCDLGVCHFLPSSIGLSQFTRAAHEWQGRMWYRLRGRI
jgi:uncharacterized SAM-binding protein YcdF (DUF218 family)